MGVAFLIVAGGVLGWLAAIIACVEDGRGLLLNIALGALGALIGGLVISPLVGGGELVSGSYDVGALLLGLLGSAALLVIVSLMRRRRAR